MQWNQKTCAFLQQKVNSVQNLEQTLELRLPDGMPDVGNVICAWGQPMIRSKQWRSESMHMSGGVNAWVLYAPEDGSGPRILECWLPVQGKWSFPESKREGVMRIGAQLRSVDARLLSARKLMVRACVGILGEALEPGEVQLTWPEGWPEDVQILENTYPMQVPREAGEKLISMEEELSLPEAKKLIAWDITPHMTEQNVLGGRAVFKGDARLHLVYMDGEDRIRSGSFSLPFAQYSQLDSDYDKEAMVNALPAVSSLELELSEGKVLVKAGIICQYIVYDSIRLKVCQDAYSPFRSVECQMQMIIVPTLLQELALPLEMSGEHNASGNTADSVFYPDYPVTYREGGDVILEVPGTFQNLFYDENGKLQAVTENVTQRLQLPAGENCCLCVQTCQLEELSDMGSQMTARIAISAAAMANQEIVMVSDIQLGQENEPDPLRPSMILRRCEDMSLWELAKGCGSTVDAIRRANSLSSDPGPDQMLLIPVC